MKSLSYIATALLAVLIIILLAVSCGGLAYAEEWPETKFYTDEDAVMITRTVWGEARGCSDDQQEAVVWCILNRVDDERFPDTIEGVVTDEGQFFGYSASNPVDDDILEIVMQVLTVWATESMMPAHERERLLPPEYVYFSGDGRENTFTTAYMGKEAVKL